MITKQKIPPIQIVEYYFKNGSLRKTSQKYGVHYQTLFRWVKIYKKGKKDKLLSHYKKPWNRFPKEIEEKIIKIKEEKPSITLGKTKKILEKQGIKVSIKGIWNVWKRYGYTGFNKKLYSPIFSYFLQWNNEAKSKFEIAIKNKDSKYLKKIINSIPSIPRNELIKELSWQGLSLRRKIEKAILISRRTHPSKQLRLVKRLYNQCKKEKLNFSAIKLGIVKLYLLLWKNDFVEFELTLKELKNIINTREYNSYSLFPFKFIICIMESALYHIKGKYKKAYNTALKCERMLNSKKIHSPNFLFHLGNIYMNLKKYRKAEKYFRKAVESGESKIYPVKITKGFLSTISLNKGNLKEALKFAKEAEFGSWGMEMRKKLFFALYYLLKGDLLKCINFANSSIEEARQDRFYLDTINAYFIISSAYGGLDKKDEMRYYLNQAKKLIRICRINEKYFPFLNLLNRKLSLIKNYKNTNPEEKLIIYLLKGNLSKAIKFSIKENLLSFFIRYLLLYPGNITEIKDKLKKTKIPSSLLNLPVFNKKIPVIKIEFLRGFKIYKNEKEIKTKFTNKEKAFLIHLALKLDSPLKSISIESVTHNFWSISKRPLKNLYSLVSKIRKELKIPSNLIKIKNGYIINKGIYFLTDLNEFENAFKRANAFLNSQKWFLAKEEFTRAFSIIRYPPFEKMYDDWSDFLRIKIINNIERNGTIFVEELIKREDIKNAIKILKKLKDIVGPSYSIQILEQKLENKIYKKKYKYLKEVKLIK